jgi:hypothetical protein
MELFIATAAVLFALGIIYNSAIGYLQNSGALEGYMAFAVAGGVAMVILGAAVAISIEVAIQLTVLFCAAGLPMIFGSIQRYVRLRSESQDRMRDEQ